MESTKTTEEFSSNLNLILSQLVVERNVAEKILKKNDNNVLKTIIEILNTNEITDNTKSNKIMDNISNEMIYRRNKILLELKYILKEHLFLPSNQKLT